MEDPEFMNLMRDIQHYGGNGKKLADELIGKGKSIKAETKVPEIGIWDVVFAPTKMKRKLIEKTPDVSKKRKIMWRNYRSATP